MRFAFIAKHRSVWPVAWLCEALDVSRSGFHAWLKRGPSAREQLDEQMTAFVRTSFVASARTYGARRVWRDVLAEGFSCGLHKIERLMRANALRARPRRRGLPKDEGQRLVNAVAPNVLDRQFVAERPNQKWIADFTYIWTAEGWLYVAAVIDLFSRRVVGWSMKAEMTAQLVVDALIMAIWRRGKPDASDVRFQDFGRKELFTPLFGMLIDSIAHRWRRSAVDVGDQALMRGLATALPRCVRGCPYLTSGVEQVGHIASVGNSPAVAPSPPVRERWRLSRAGFPISDC